MDYNYIKELYDEVRTALHMEDLNLEVVNDKNSRFYGQIRMMRGRSKNRTIKKVPISITVNTYYFENISNSEKAYHYIYDLNWTLEECILETICHEFAHISYWSHCKSHTQLTKTYFNIVKAARKPTTSVAANPTSVLTTLKDLCFNLNIDDKKARRILRGSNITKPGKTWTWEYGIPQEVIDLLKNN